MQNRSSRLRTFAIDWFQAVIAIVASVALIVYIRHAKAANGSSVASPTLMQVTAAQTIGRHPTWYGSSTAPYTLVEFADYQCPPCRLMGPIASKLVDSALGKLRLTFRNYPLHTLHPRAEAAAVAGEIARANGKFWQVHDALYKKQSDLDDKTIAGILKDAGIHLPPNASSSAEAAIIVGMDGSDGDKCEVMGTPTFYLFVPDGRVYQLGELQQVSDFTQQ